MDAHVPAKWYRAAASVAQRQSANFHHGRGIKMLAGESWLLYEFCVAD